jgi:ribosomal-protein-alanine N-acetyltransferase
MNIAIRPIGVEAAALLAALHAASFPPNQAWDEAAIALMLDLPGHFGLIAVNGATPEGFALGRVQAFEAEILTLAVLPEARRKGLGWALLDGLLTEAKRCGALEVFLEVAANNAPAKALYARAGAAEVGRRPRYYADGTDALVLRIGLDL